VPPAAPLPPAAPADLAAASDPLAFERVLTGLAAALLSVAPAGASVRLDVAGDAGLALGVDAVPAPWLGETPPASWPPVAAAGPDAPSWSTAMAALGEWRLERRHAGRLHVAQGAGAVRAPAWTHEGTAEGEGVRLAFRVRPAAARGELQSPAVLYALRELAARHPAARFTVRLPAGTRDVMRARAGLDSRPGAERRGSGAAAGG
jgi:hypothetical protein